MTLTPETVLLFELSGRTFSLPLSAIEEILPAVTLLPIPGAPLAMEGLLEIRGRIVPVLNIAAILNLETRKMEYTDHLIILRIDEHSVAIRVDCATELADLADLLTSKQGVNNSGSAVVAGIAKHKGALVASLDVTSIATVLRQWQNSSHASPVRS